MDLILLDIALTSYDEKMHKIADYNPRKIESALVGGDALYFFS